MLVFSTPDKDKELKDKKLELEKERKNCRQKKSSIIAGLEKMLEMR